MALTTQMLWVLLILGLAVYLFAFEVMRVDVAAVFIMVVLGLSGIVPSEHLFDGFSSNAVISIIAIMIIGAGLDKTGLMGQVAGYILKVGGATEKRIIPIVSGTVGVISSFMQNIGAAALFLPVVSRISTRTGIPLSRLLMPMGFCAILGGTMTMVGSSPLILLNDLIVTSNQNLASGVEAMRTFELFDVTPIGAALVLTGIVYFVVASRLVLPSARGSTPDPAATIRYFEKVYGIKGDIFEATTTTDSPLVGKTVGEIEAEGAALFILGIRNGDEIRLAPPVDEVIWVGTVFALMGEPDVVRNFTRTHGLSRQRNLESFLNVINPTRAGISEVVVPPGSSLIGRTRGEVRMRKRYGAHVLAVHRGEETIRRGLGSLPMMAGDTMVIHSRWEDLAVLAKDPNFVVVTDFPQEEIRPNKVAHALFFFVLALGLVLATDLKLSLALLTGAIGMVITGVIKVDEAYRAVSWQTVFLLASLIPLGLAMEVTGTAVWVAQQILSFIGDLPIWGVQTVVAVLATAFTLVMSNVGATVLLVPLAVNIAIGAGADPAVFALTVALATSNSFLIPTHQVNALIMGPAGYKVADFLRAGGIMTALFLVVMMVMLNIVF